jgi:hypothetical protein
MAKQESKLQRYQQLQSLLKLSVSYSDNVFDLDMLIEDFVCLDNDGKIFIKYLPVDGDFVYVSDFDGNNRGEVPIDSFSDDVAEHILKCMTKAFLVNEIRERL